MNLSPENRIIANQPMIRRMLMLLTLVPLGVLAQSAPPDPLSLRTRDAHQDLLVVADPYLTAERYKGAFGKNSPYDAGLLAVQVYFRNDNASPIRFRQDAVRLVFSEAGERSQRLAPLSAEEVADRTLLKAHANPNARPRLPLPGSGNHNGRGKDWQEMVSVVRSAGFTTDIVAPHSTSHGFIFFDVDHDFDAIHNAHLYIPDLSFMTDDKPLFFFEIDLADAAAN